MDTNSIHEYIITAFQKLYNLYNPFNHIKLEHPCLCLNRLPSIVASWSKHGLLISSSAEYHCTSYKIFIIIYSSCMYLLLTHTTPLVFHHLFGVYVHDSSLADILSLPDLTSLTDLSSLADLTSLTDLSSLADLTSLTDLSSLAELTS